MNIFCEVLIKFRSHFWSGVPPQYCYGSDSICGHVRDQVILACLDLFSCLQGSSFSCEMPMASLGEMVHLARRAAVAEEERKQLERQERYTRDRPKPPTIGELIERDSGKRKAREQLKKSEEKEIDRNWQSNANRKLHAKSMRCVRPCQSASGWIPCGTQMMMKKLIDKSPACRCILRVMSQAKHPSLEAD